MNIIHKKLLSVATVFFVSFLCMPTKIYATEGDTLLRKGLGIVGTGMIAYGLWKVATGKPRKGVKIMLLGGAIAVGGICSDLILHRAKMYFDKDEMNNFLQVHYEGGVAAIGNVAMAQEQLEGGWKTFKAGNIFYGLDRMYDGMYHGVRAKCRQLLYRQLWT